LLHDDTFSSKPIQFLVLDLSKVDGVDFSAAEAFTRINRILSVRDVQMIMCGIAPNCDVWKSLFNVGLLNEDDGVLFFEDLNSALENCENQLLKAFYQRRDDLVKMDGGQKYLGEYMYVRPGITAATNVALRCPGGTKDPVSWRDNVQFSKKTPAP